MVLSIRTRSSFKIISRPTVSQSHQYWSHTLIHLHSPLDVPGYLVLGIDYFFGDPIHRHRDDPNFDREAWIVKSAAQAKEALPKWLSAVRETYGSDIQYSAVGKSLSSRKNVS
jgi:hypothetical protein